MQALRRQQLIYPGWLAKFMALTLSTALRALRVKIMGAIMGFMGSMTKRLTQ